MSLVPDPLVSVIMPFLNTGPFIKESIESVIQQTYSAWELILVDDGSTDNSTAIAKSYVAIFTDKIKYVEHEHHANMGLSPSRNAGIRHAQGSLVAFLDSDDVWLKENLAKQVRFFFLNPEVSMLCSATKYWYSWQSSDLEDKVIQVGAPGDRIYEPPMLAKCLYPLGQGAAPCMCGLMIKMPVLQKLRKFEDSFGENQLFEDQAFLMKIYLNEKVYVSTECDNVYRQRKNSLMHGIIAEGKYEKGHYFFLKWLKCYLKANRISDHDISRRVQELLVPYQYPLLYNAFSRIRQKLKRLSKRLLYKTDKR
jgi:glycosyltransferase involved in cell wall biosynthesis